MLPAPTAAALVGLFLAGPAPAPARNAPAAPRAETSPSPFHLDVETDPVAFAFSGYSLHVGLGYRHLRLDLGLYAMDVPGFAEPNAGFESSYAGTGAKLQLFPFHEQEGGFVGVDGSVNRLTVEAEGTGAEASQLQLGAGLNVGWRFVLLYGLYATPWLGVMYQFGADDMTVGAESYRPNPVTVFPAVHLGYRFL